MSQSVISLSLQNTTPLAQPVSVFNPLPQQESSGSGNSSQSYYTYNVYDERNQGLLNNYSYLTVVYSKNGGSYQMVTINYGSPLDTVDKIIAALNSLGQSVFFQSSIDDLPNSRVDVSCYSLSPSGDSYYYSSIGVNNNYVTNSFIGKTTFGINGTVIYNNGYNANTGVGALTRINTSNNFWINNVPNIINGALNRCGVSSANILNSSINGAGIFTNIYSQSSKQVYVGIGTNLGANTFGTLGLYVNNVQQVNLFSNYITTNVNTILGTSSTNALYQFWNIYPINIQAGNNYFLLNSGYHLFVNSSTVLAFEVYDNTAAEIAAATSYSGLNVLFSSKDYIQNMI